jgi:hypothetical protein
MNNNSHFYRSNSWNISPQQQQQQNTSNNGNSYSSNGQYLLLKNIPPKVSFFSCFFVLERVNINFFLRSINQLFVYYALNMQLVL